VDIGRHLAPVFAQSVPPGGPIRRFAKALSSSDGRRPRAALTALAGLVCLQLAVTARAQEEIYLQVTSPGLRSVVVAIPEFGQRGTVDRGAAATFLATLDTDLRQTAVIALLPAAAIATAAATQGDAAARHAAFRAVGAQFLLDGTLASLGSQLITEVRLWDLASSEIAYSRRLQGTATLAPTMAHTLANELLRLFTGKPGPFLSRIAFISDRSGAKELWVMRWDGSEAQQLTSHKSIALGPTWSTDGEWLAFTSFLRGQPQLFILRPTEGYLKPLSAIPGVNSSPSFSPDGREVAFAAGDHGNTNVYVANVEAGEVRRLTSSRAIETQPAWSPSGRQIAYTSTAAGNPQLYLMDAEGTNNRRVTFDDTFADEAAWAPDGVRIAYTTKVEARFQIATVDLRTGLRLLIAGPGNNESPCWSPDGNMLAFVSDRTGSKQIYITDATGTPRRITREGNNSQPSWVAQVQ
jgi:TolB protein